MTNEETVEIIIPLNGEPEGSFETVTINGVVTEVTKGVKVAVARNVGEVLAGAYGFDLGDTTESVGEVGTPEEKPLSKQNRDELNATAESLGIDSPEDFENKEEVIEAIEDEQEEQD